MMKSLIKLIFYFVIFVLFLFVLLPKENLYYEVEKHLEKEGVIISNEELDSSLMGLDINNGTVYVKGIKSLDIKQVKLRWYLFFNEIEINDLNLDESFSNMAPSPIKNLKVTYTVLDIFKAKITGDSVYGKIDGFIDLKEKKVLIYFDATNKMKKDYSSILTKLRNENGRYIYEYKY